ncbi:LysR substrate-binding domain-containing protein [Pseudomonas sp. NPDC007930]|uniref:LysR family transcriptional regulator n=1 Tax=Pseudomonas sp. NPDC007930 TaxID=3364417 RepID=UPI0036ED7F3A
MASPTLADLRAFIAVAEQRSFRRAADLLGLSRSALSHAVSGLEARLGVQLLHRTTRSVALTEAGERLLAQLYPLLGELERVLHQAGGDGGPLRGRLRINGSEGALRYLLQHLVPAFMARYPGVELDLAAEGRLVDIVAQGFDAGVRLGEALPKDMVAIPLGPELRFIAVAAPAYLRAYPAPRVPDDLAGHRCIRQRLPSGKRYRWEFSQHGQALAVDVPGGLTLDNTQLMTEAAAAGLGIAYVPQPYAEAALARGQLQQVLADWCPPGPGLHLYFPAQRHMPAPLRAFVDLVKGL